VYLVLALALGAFVGVVACLPHPPSDVRTTWLSIAIGVAGSFVGWEGSAAIGMGEIGPLAQLFVALVAAGAIVAVYHAATSERTGLR
jgi:uncharacterized membrane protein YeaQ/YmgE (transglycosylase-associated protein family)